MTKRMYIFTNIILSIITVTIIGIILMMTIPCKVLTFEDDKLPITNHTVKAGDIVEYQVKCTKYRNLPAVVNRQLMNSYIYNYTPTVGNISVGYSDRKIQINIPDYAEAGIYFVRITYEYQVNPLRKEKITKDTETFMVIRDEEE